MFELFPFAVNGYIMGDFLTDTTTEEIIMTAELTLSIIKPDAVGKQYIGPIYQRFAENGLAVVAARMMHMDRTQAESFYGVHKDRPFFNDLVEFMISGPIMVQVLSGDNAIQKYRDLMGATNPQEAAPGTIRADFAESIDANAVHGSDSQDTAETEVAFFFKDADIVNHG